ncbi:MAG: phosphodiesterase [Rhodospirillales bacterium]
MEKLIHLTDPHLVSPGRRLFASDPQARLAPAIDTINRQHGDAKAVFVTGDLTHWGEASAYQALRDLLSGLRVPYHLLLGNHDQRGAFHATFPEVPRDAAGFVQYEVALESGVCLALDTLQDGTTPGRLCPDRLAWLADRLQAHRERDLFIFLHHPPFDVGIPGMDRLRLLEGDEDLRTLLSAQGRVRHIFFGHVHRPIAGSWAGIGVSSLFATNHQVALQFDAPEDVPGSLEPAALGVVLIDAMSVIVHMQSYSDPSPAFSLSNPKAEAAQSLEELIASACGDQP